MQRTVIWLVGLGLCALPGLVRADKPKAVDKLPARVKEFKTDKEYLVWCIGWCEGEVKLGEKAAKEAKSEQVQKLASAVAAHHKKMRDSLMNVAKAQKLAVASGLDKEYRDTMIRLFKLKGDDLDKEYLAHLVDSHQKAVKILEKWKKDTKDDSLSKTAANHLAKVKEHLSEAKKAQGKKSD